MRIDRTFVAVVMFFLLAAQPGCRTSPAKSAAQQPNYAGMTCSSTIDGRIFTSSVRGDQLLHAPRWSPRDDRPPLSPGAARRAAKQELARNVKDADQWVLDEIVLNEPFGGKPSSFGVGCWIYQCHFIGPAHQTEHGSESDSSVNIIVLMDGSVIPLKPHEVK